MESAVAIREMKKSPEQACTTTIPGFKRVNPTLFSICNPATCPNKKSCRVGLHRCEIPVLPDCELSDEVLTVAIKETLEEKPEFVFLRNNLPSLTTHLYNHLACKIAFGKAAQFDTLPFAQIIQEALDGAPTTVDVAPVLPGAPVVDGPVGAGLVVRAAPGPTAPVAMNPVLAHSTVYPSCFFSSWRTRRLSSPQCLNWRRRIKPSSISWLTRSSITTVGCTTVNERRRRTLLPRMAIGAQARRALQNRTKSSMRAVETNAVFADGGEGQACLTVRAERRKSYLHEWLY
jgi:hypothetical protein